MSKSDYSVRFQPERLRQMIENGMNARDIMKALKISRFTLKEHLVMLQNRDRKIYVIKGLMNNPDTEKKLVEGIVFSREVLERAGYSAGDAFEMTVEQDRIVLKKIEN